MAKKLPCIICGEMTYFTSLCDDCMEGNLNADEVWKPIEGYERYQISNYGRVQSFRQGRYIQGFMAHGYRQVNLINNGEKIFPSVHRLVAEYFIPNPEKFTFVRHKDGNKLNNYYRNIEWIPNDDRFTVLAGDKNPQSRPVIQMDKDGNFIQRYANASVAYKETGIKVNNIHSVCYGRSRLAKGYRWKFEE